MFEILQRNLGSHSSDYEGDIFGNAVSCSLVKGNIFHCYSIC